MKYIVTLNDRTYEVEVEAGLTAKGPVHPLPAGAARGAGAPGECFSWNSG